MNNPSKILVVDDEASVVEVVRLYLERDGYQVAVAHDGATALNQVDTFEPDLIVLDVMLPEIDGLEILRRLRKQEKEVAIILLTARTQETDRIFGLELGADDYVTKPFSPAELVARVKAVLRRTGVTEKTVNETIRFSNIIIEPDMRRVELHGELVELTATEFDLLYFMASNPRQVFRRDQLLEKVWGYSDFLDPSTVTVHIRRLREKIEPEPSKPIHLLTVWGVGYKFEAEAS